MHKFILSCIVIVIGWQHAAGNPISGYVYSREADVWLRLHIAPASWADAGMRCLLEDGILASPTTSAISQVMTAMMAEQQLPYGVFTGINSIMSKENFKSLEGISLVNIPVGWAPGQPDNDNADEDCLALTGAGALADVSCESMLPFFCRKESVSKCGLKGNVPAGYEWEPRTGSCYKFHRVAETWRGALETCHKEGGYLAIINSRTESTVLKEIITKNPSNKITGAHEPNYISCGFRRWDDGEWATIFGDPLADVGFTDWSAGEPNNRGGDELCGSIFRDGLLNDTPCYQKYAYICEMTPL